jgi:fatty acid desaturase
MLQSRNAALEMHPEESGPERRAWLSRDELRELGRIPTMRVAVSGVVLWSALFGCLELSLRSQSIVTGALCFCAIGVLFNALGSYWTHEATHFNLAPNRKWNDIFGDLFFAGPTGLTVAQYRWQHFRHHAHINEPEWEIDQSAWICLRGPRLYAQILLHLIGWHALNTILRYRESQHDPRKASLPPRSFASLASFAVVNGAVFLRCAISGQWYMYFLMWVAPLFTIAVAIGNIGTIVEHQPSSDVCDSGLVRLPVVTRLMHAGWIERVLLGHVGFYYHYEHHLYPRVPVHRLPELRRLLEVRGCFDQPEIVRADGYLKTLWRLSRDRRRPRSAMTVLG